MKKRIREDEKQKKAVEVMDKVFSHLQCYEPKLEKVHLNKSNSFLSKLFNISNVPEVHTYINTNHQLKDVKVNIYMFGSGKKTKRKMTVSLIH